MSDLPTQLVAAFHATLEEVIDADLILHVRDISHTDSDAQRDDVIAVLSEIGISGENGAPLIEAWNKTDLLDGEAFAFHAAEAVRRDDVLPVSALTGEGVDALLTLIAERLTKARRIHSVVLSTGDGASIAWLRARGTVVNERFEEDQMVIDVRLSDEDHARFQSRSLA